MIRRARWNVLQTVSAGVIAVPLMLAATSGVLAQSTDTANGGSATAGGGSGSVVFGDVMTGQNIGNVINAGDIVNSDAELSGGEVSYPTIMYVTVPSGDPTADASGGNDSAVGETEPDTVIVRGDRDRNDVDVRTNDTNNNTNTNTNNNTATGGAGGDGGDSTVTVNPEP
jgi:hypothetical protein